MRSELGARFFTSGVFSRWLFPSHGEKFIPATPQEIMETFYKALNSRIPSADGHGVWLIYFLIRCIFLHYVPLTSQNVPAPSVQWTSETHLGAGPGNDGL